MRGGRNALRRRCTRSLAARHQSSGTRLASFLRGPCVARSRPAQPRADTAARRRLRIPPGSRSSATAEVRAGGRFLASGGPAEVLVGRKSTARGAEECWLGRGFVHRNGARPKPGTTQATSASSVFRASTGPNPSAPKGLFVTLRLGLAVVVGGSIGGMLAARVPSEFREKVTLVTDGRLRSQVSAKKPLRRTPTHFRGSPSRLRATRSTTWSARPDRSPHPSGCACPPAYAFPSVANLVAPSTKPFSPGVVSRVPWTGRRRPSPARKLRCSGGLGS